MSLKDVPVRARLWAPDRSLPRFWETSSFFVRFNLTSFAQYLRAAETRGGVAQACRAAPSGDEKVRKCRSSVPCCTIGRRKRAEVSPKRAVLHPRATKMYESVAQACRAAPSGDEDVRKCRPSVPCCTLGRRKSAKVLPKRAVLHPRATKMYESVAQACRAAPSGDEKVRKCCPREPCCTLGRRRCTKVSPKRAVLYPWATKKCESVAQESRAAPSGDEDVRKCCPREPCCTLGRR